MPAKRRGEHEVLGFGLGRGGLAAFGGWLLCGRLCSFRGEGCAGGRDAGVARLFVGERGTLSINCTAQQKFSAWVCGAATGGGTFEEGALFTGGTDSVTARMHMLPHQLVGWLAALCIH